MNSSSFAFSKLISVFVGSMNQCKKWNCIKSPIQWDFGLLSKKLAISAIIVIVLDGTKKKNWMIWTFAEDEYKKHTLD